jgi:beta-mannosidase
VSWRLTDVEGSPLANGRAEVEIAPGSDARVETLDLRSHLTKLGPRGLLLWLELRDGDERLSSNLALFARPKHLELADPGIRWSVSEAEPGRFVVMLTAERPAFWVWLSLASSDAAFSDNFVHLFPGEPLTVTVTPVSPVSRDDLEAQLRVASIVDTYR